MFLVNFLRFFLIFSSMICGYGKHIALPCRYVCLKAFLILKVVMKLVIYAISQGPLLFNDFQSHPAFVEYHDLLEDLEEKLSSVVNLEEKWGLFWISNPRLWQQIVANWSNSMGTFPWPEQEQMWVKSHTNDQASIRWTEQTMSTRKLNHVIRCVYSFKWKWWYC